MFNDTISYAEIIDVKLVEMVIIFSRLVFISSWFLQNTNIEYYFTHGPYLNVAACGPDVCPSLSSA